MKPPDHDQLLRDILGEEIAPQFRQASLTRAVTELRTRRRRRVLLSGAATAAVILLFCTVVMKRDRESAPAHLPAAHSKSRVELIDDQQLLALFPDRSTALIGAAGETQTLIFLDPPRSADPRRSSY